MPVGGEAVGNAIAGFFPGPKIERKTYSEQLDTAQQQQARELYNLGQAAPGALADYTAAVKASTPGVLATNADTMGRLGDLASQYSTFDPASTYERVRSGNIASLADQFVNLANYGNAGDKAALLAMGYGGRGPSSYESILRADRISRNIAPVLSTIYSGLGADTASLNANRLANLAGVAPALQYRASIPGSADYRALLPYQAQAAMLNPQIGLGQGLGEALRTNTAGFQAKQNQWANFFQQMGRATDQAADTAISLYTGGMLGGGGGMGGGGTNVAAPAATFSPYSSPQAMPNYNFSL